MNRFPRIAAIVERARSEARWYEWVLIAIAGASAILLRHALLLDSNGDTGNYGFWINQLRAGGFHTLGTHFANYNPPYLYLLYLGSLTHLPNLAIVKIISAGFDLIIAAGVATLTYRLRHSFVLAALAGAASSLLPEVFLNSGYWGQTDATYGAFLIWAAALVVWGRPTLAWVLFGIAFSFKLQALFVLPWMAIAFIVQRHPWRVLAAFVATCVVAYVPSLLAGSSIRSLLTTYFDQASHLKLPTVNAVNLYQWVPKDTAATVIPAGMWLTVGIVAVLAVLYLRRARVVARLEVWLVQVAAAIGVVVPFVLPEMHDRYFYGGDLLAAVCVILSRNYIIPVIILQFTALCAYSPFLFRVDIIPLPVAAMLQLVAVGWIVGLSFSATQSEASPWFTGRPALAGLALPHEPWRGR